jgi:hypothetical protein
MFCTVTCFLFPKGTQPIDLYLVGWNSSRPGHNRTTKLASMGAPSKIHASSLRRFEELYVKDSVQLQRCVFYAFHDHSSIEGGVIRNSWIRVINQTICENGIE